MSTTAVAERPKPFVFPEYCKGCGRCIDVCTRHCISLGTEINPQTGLIPIVLDLEQCNGCGLCITACPEPYGLRPQPPGEHYELTDPAAMFGPRPHEAPVPVDIPDSACRSRRWPRWWSRGTTPRRLVRSSPAAATFTATRSRRPRRAPS